MTSPPTDLYQSIADAHGVMLGGSYSESETAEIMRISLQTLRRMRANGEISFMRLSKRKIFYLGRHIVECLDMSVEPRKDPASMSKAQ